MRPQLQILSNASLNLIGPGHVPYCGFSLVIEFDDFRHESRRISSTDNPSGDCFSPHSGKLSVPNPIKIHDLIGHRFFTNDGDPEGLTVLQSCSINERDRRFERNAEE
jgi:hypothetical protein